MGLTFNFCATIRMVVFFFYSGLVNRDGKHFNVTKILEMLINSNAKQNHAFTSIFV